MSSSSHLAVSIDVAIENDDHSIACEITIETPGSKKLGNIQKALDAGFDKVIVICPNPRKRKGLLAAVAKRFTEISVPIMCIPPGELENHLAPSAPVPQKAEVEKPMGFAVKRKFADRRERKPISEAEAMESIARIMRAAKDETD
jgi:hypothetical protein